MKKIVGVVKGLAYFILIVMIIFNLFILISNKLSGKGYPMLFGYTYFIVQSGSMQPTINVGDIIIVELTNEVKTDDIVTYSEEGFFVTHRIIEEKENGYITQGDSNNTPDGIVNKQSVIGKVTKISPFLGKLKLALSNWVVIGIIITFVVLLNIYTSIERRYQE